jgi:heme/copper-type cytochrome/quinol oxidase subunit 3
VSFDIPYASQPRPDTGVSNATLGMWLFIASELMLFGALFSAYALLRMGDPAWPDQGATLNVALAAFNTVILVASSIAITRAARAASRQALPVFRRLMLVTLACGLFFLLLKSVEYSQELGAGLRPATNNFLGLYFTMTGLHALHVLGGLGVNAWLLATAASQATREARFASRARNAALYWNLVDGIWLVMFIVLYLL